MDLHLPASYVTVSIRPLVIVMVDFYSHRRHAVVVVFVVVARRSKYIESVGSGVRR